MNEKLEKELEKWRHEHFSGKRDGVYSGEYLERESQLDIAEHFYNLALADVKDEIARLMRKTDCKNIRGHAAMRAYNEVFDFLDEQSK